MRGSLVTHHHLASQLLLLRLLLSLQHDIVLLVPPLPPQLRNGGEILLRAEIGGWQEIYGGSNYNFVVGLVAPDRGTVTFQLERWDDQQVVGTSPNFGKVKFLPTAFTMIQFNLDKAKTVDSDAGEAGDTGPSDLILFDQ